MRELCAWLRYNVGDATDGDPADDIALALAAGNHSGLVGGIGRVTGHPDGKAGLIMPRIVDEYKSLGTHQAAWTALCEKRSMYGAMAIC